jgi:hypothetical protein
MKQYEFWSLAARCVYQRNFTEITCSHANDAKMAHSKGPKHIIIHTAVQHARQ